MLKLLNTHDVNVVNIVFTLKLSPFVAISKITEFTQFRVKYGNEQSCLGKVSDIFHLCCLNYPDIFVLMPILIILIIFIILIILIMYKR